MSSSLRHVTATLFCIPAIGANVDALGVAHRCIQRAGFDIVARIDADSAAIAPWWHRLDGAMPLERFPQLTTRLTLIVAIDVSPWRQGLADSEANEGAISTDNQRIVARGPEIEARLQRELGPSTHAPHCAWTRTSADTYRILAAIDPETRDRLREHIDEAASWMRPPPELDIVEQCSGFNTNGEVYRVSAGGEDAILRMFRLGREHHLDNEVKVLSLQGEVPGLPRLLKRGSNWVLTDFFPSATPISRVRDRHGYIPLMPARRAFEICRQVHRRGYALLDFIPGNVLVNPAGDVRLIDFEWLQELPTPEPFETGPTIAGYAHRSGFYGPNGPDKSYEADWRPLTGVPYAALMNRPLPWLRVERRARSSWRRSKTRACRAAGRVRRDLGKTLAACLHAPFNQ